MQVTYIFEMRPVECAKCHKLVWIAPVEVEPFICASDHSIPLIELEAPKEEVVG